MLSEKAKKQKVYTHRNKPTTIKKKKTLNKEASKWTSFPLHALGSLAEERKRVLTEIRRI